VSITQGLDISALSAPLLGDQVMVRPFTAEDISETYLGWLQDSEVVRYSGQRFRAHTLESCQAYLASFTDSSNHFLAICDQKSGAMLGTLTVYCSVPHGTADIGIMIGERKVWGKGIGAEAFCLVLSALKASGAIRKVTAGTLAVNQGMVRIMEKAGMRHEATRQAQELLDGAPVDVVYYATFCHD
jgi:[ribosomal protein S5]-alanine N-acetyltransferase